MAIVNNIRYHEHLLREGRGIDIGGKVVEIAMRHESRGNRGNRVADGGRVELVVVVVWRCRGVKVVNGRDVILLGMSKTQSV